MLSDAEGNDLIDQDFFITVMGESYVLSCLVLRCLVSFDLILPFLSCLVFVFVHGFVLFCLHLSVLAC